MAATASFVGMAASSARNSANNCFADIAFVAVRRASKVFCKLPLVAVAGLAAAIGAAKAIGDELAFVVMDAAGVCDGVVCSVLRCHNQAASAARTRTLATPIEILFELFLCDDMVPAFVRLIDSTSQIFCKIHSTFGTRPKQKPVVKLPAAT